MNRRGFLTGALGFLAAPAIVRASSLMPVSALPPEPIFTSHMGTWEGVRLFSYEEPAFQWLMIDGVELSQGDRVLVKDAAFAS